MTGISAVSKRMLRGVRRSGVRMRIAGILIGSRGVRVSLRTPRCSLQNSDILNLFYMCIHITVINSKMCRFIIMGFV